MTTELRYREKFFLKQVAKECEAFVDILKLTQDGEDVQATCRIVFVIDDFEDAADFERVHVPVNCKKVRRSSLR